MIKVVGFDLDRVLASEDYDFEVWNEIIPKAYAKKNNIPEGRARDHVHAEYYRGQYIEEIGSEWFSLDYWLERLKLSFEEVIDHIPDEQEMIYEDVEETLKKLSKKYDLVLITNSVGFFREIKTKKISEYLLKNCKIAKYSQKKYDLYSNGEIVSKIDMLSDEIFCM